MKQTLGLDQTSASFYVCCFVQTKKNPSDVSVWENQCLNAVNIDGFSVAILNVYYGSTRRCDSFGGFCDRATVRCVDFISGHVRTVRLLSRNLRELSIWYTFLLVLVKLDWEEVFSPWKISCFLENWPPKNNTEISKMGHFGFISSSTPPVRARNPSY